MKTSITNNPTDCALGGSSSPAMPVYKFVAFTSNCYTDSKATLEFLQDGKPEEFYYSTKKGYNWTPEQAAHDIIRKGMSASFLKAEPVLVDKTPYNQQALEFYNQVREAVLAIGVYKVVVGVDTKPDAMDEAFTQWLYTPYIYRCGGYNERLVCEVPVTDDYQTILQSPEVLAYVADFRAKHEVYLAERASDEAANLLRIQKQLVETTDLLTGCEFLRIDGSALIFATTKGCEFEITAQYIGYDGCGLFVDDIQVGEELE